MLRNSPDARRQAKDGVRKAIAAHTPLLLQGLPLATPRSWRSLQSNWSSAALADQFGAAQATLRDAGDGLRSQFGFVPLSRNSSSDGETMALVDFLHALDTNTTEGKMLFDVDGGALRGVAAWQPFPGGLRSAVEGGGVPPLWRPTTSIGGVGVGVAAHTHGSAWLTTVRGSKLWLLYPPGTVLDRQLLLRPPHEWLGRWREGADGPEVMTICVARRDGWHGGLANNGGACRGLGWMAPHGIHDTAWDP